MGEEVEVIAPPRMGNDSEGLLLGAPPSAIDRRPARNLNATTRSPPVSASRAVKGLQASGEDRGAYGENRFATGEDEEKRRMTKTEAPTAKTGSPQAKTKRIEEGQRPGRLGRRPRRRLRSRRPEGKASESKRFESREENLVMGPMGRRGSDVIYQMMQKYGCTPGIFWEYSC